MSSDEDKEYEAILVDTSIFDRYGLRLEKGLLGKLSQFKESDIDYLLPDVIKGEIKSHLEKKVKSSRLIDYYLEYPALAVANILGDDYLVILSMFERDKIKNAIIEQREKLHSSKNLEI